MAWKIIDGYEMVVGLEVHAELATRTKIFCACPTAYGAAPNTQCCPVCLGYPGALPVLNGEVVHYAAKAGLALGCEIARYSKHDRKNYFYPDLPKAYQISQFDLPLCTGGQLTISTKAGEKIIGITRIHIEEDAGKLLHDERGTFLDMNRCGVPLIEIVSEPDIRTPQEADAYLRKLRTVLRYTGVSDCKMQEGSLRCDVNLSIRKPGEPFGTRTEMKNLNSFVSVVKAIEAEYARQVAAVREGETIRQETRRFDQRTGETYAMRRKENANDYRYFPEPDLAPIALTEDQIAAWQAELPLLPDARKAAYIKEYGLTDYAAEQLVAELIVAEYYEAAAKLTRAPRTLANLLITEVFRLLEGEGASICIPAAHLARLADMAESGEINNNTAKAAIAEIWQSGEEPDAYVTRNGLRQISDAAELLPLVQRAVEENPKIVAQYYGGKDTAKRAIMGAAMRLASGKANPNVLMRLVDEVLDGK